MEHLQFPEMSECLVIVADWLLLSGAYALVLVNQVALVEQHAKAIEESSTLSDLKVAVQEENQVEQWWLHDLLYDL